ncbi:hypothetical protein V496_00030 [Pseudogymnoascus sp. VKM F-4515 (FW-2607)]|nr:hypothetical protein V496_00030 [Pseudogymnoascus sp. VKM F-4515 (FW-2607)]
MPAQPSQPMTTPSMSTIRIGDAPYDIAAVSKIPYIKSFIDFKSRADPLSTEFAHDAIPLFDIALKGIENGYRRCFRLLPANVLQYALLCETYDILGVHILRGQTIDYIIEGVKSNRGNYRPNSGHNKAAKAKARDAAFKLLYLILRGDFKDETRDPLKIFNAVLFLISDPITFKPNTREVVRAAWRTRFIASKEQIRRLDRQEETNAVKQAAKQAADDNGDITTDEEKYNEGFR